MQVDPVTGKIDHAGVIFENGIPEHFCKDKKSSEDFQSEYLAVTGACFLIRRDLFLKLEDLMRLTKPDLKILIFASDYRCLVSLTVC